MCVKFTLLVVLFVEIGVLDINARITKSYEGVCGISATCDLMMLRGIIRTYVAT